MGKVTYILGAGASHHCLPVVKDMPKMLETFRVNLVDLPIEHSEQLKNISTYTMIQARDLMNSYCLRIIENAKKHASIDTYAKKLFITKRFEEYYALKAILSSAFMFHQIKNPPDHRYDAFFASTLGNDSMDFNNNIRIVSWNYDFQIEQSFWQFSQSDDLKQNQNLLHVYPEGWNIEHYEDRFSVFKINGTTSFRETIQGGDSIYNVVEKFTMSEDEKLLKSSIWYFMASVYSNDTVKSSLKFSWDSKFPSSLLTCACKAISDSDAIVVIGYSFPFFNRDVDKVLLVAACKNEMTKIYVQDIDPNAIKNKLISTLPPGYPQGLIETIRAKSDKDPNKLSDQFFLPPEL
jgi:hypothetical protein